MVLEGFRSIVVSNSPTMQVHLGISNATNMLDQYAHGMSLPGDAYVYESVSLLLDHLLNVSWHDRTHSLFHKVPVVSEKNTTPKPGQS